MKKEELIHIWKTESDRMYSETESDKQFIMQTLAKKTRTGNRSIYFHLAFYGLIQLVNLSFLSINLSGYASNPSMVWVLISMMVLTIGILVYGLDTYYRFRSMNDFSESLYDLIEKQLWFYKRPFEIWQVLSVVSVILMISNLNFWVDNDQGTYVIYNKALYAGITAGIFLVLYGTQKLSSMHGLRSLKARLADLKDESLERTGKLDRSRRRYLWFWLLLFLVLTAFLIFGLVRALNF